MRYENKRNDLTKGLTQALTLCVTDYKPVSTKKKERKKGKKRIVLSDNVPSEKKKKHTRCSKKPHVIAGAVLIYVSRKLFRRNIFWALGEVRAVGAF